jgi:hypothetical protein
MMETYLTLKGVADVSKQLLLESISQGVREFFDWALLNAGGFTTVDVSSPGTNDPYADEVLHPVHQEGVEDNRIWEAIHPDWVYETGVDYSPPPVRPTGVYVNATFYPTATTTGPFKHYINFPEGRVVFDHAIAASSLVQVSYSYRWLNFYDNEVPWFRDVVLDPVAVSDSPSTGAFINLLKENRVQLPAVIIEPVMNRRLRGMMLGSGALWVEQDILFHLIAERSDERSNIMDIITLQKDKTFYLFDVNARNDAGDYPVDARGVPIAGAKMYPSLVAMPPAGYRWKSCYFSRMTPQDVSLQLPLYRGVVRATLEVDFNSI